jgi:hypothetical protein
MPRRAFILHLLNPICRQVQLAHDVMRSSRTTKQAATQNEHETENEFGAHLV